MRSGLIYGLLVLLFGLETGIPAFGQHIELLHSNQVHPDDYFGHRMVNALAFDHTNNVIVSGHADGTTCVSSTEEGTEVIRRKFDHGIRSLSIAPDDSHLVVGTYQDLEYWTWETNQSRPMLSIDRDSLVRSALLPDGSVVCVCFGSAFVWDSQAGRRVIRRHPAASQSSSYPRCMAVSSDSRLVALGITDNTVEVYRLRDGKLVFLFGVPEATFSTSGVGVVKFSPNAKQLVATSHLGKFPAHIMIWEAESWTLAGKIDCGSGVLDLAYSPNGHYLAIATMENQIELWDILRRKCVATADRGTCKPTTCVSFSRDGRLLATGNRDGIVRVWRVSFD